MTTERADRLAPPPRNPFRVGMRVRRDDWQSSLRMGTVRVTKDGHSLGRLGGPTPCLQVSLGKPLSLDFRRIPRPNPKPTAVRWRRPL